MMAQYDSAFDMGTELPATKLTVILTLCWPAIEIAWAWLFPPTAPAVEATAIVSTRSALEFKPVRAAIRSRCRPGSPRGARTRMSAGSPRPAPTSVSSGPDAGVLKVIQGRLGFRARGIIHAGLV
ncbi:hypothetical protein [Nocardia sp. NPDC002869]|uniref:hypothetical protein n=1 Tax=Nocardia sp. NPDC002869 TaxID=3161032 RepID=UPI00398D3966